MPPPLTTGLPRLDVLMHGVSGGDNIVWMIAEWSEFRALVLPYAVAAALRVGRCTTSASAPTPR